MALAKSDVSILFSGRKAKWLPLFRRLMARASVISGVEVCSTSKWIPLNLVDDSCLGVIQVTASGLVISLCLQGAGIRSPRLKTAKKLGKSLKHLSHSVTLSEASEIDGEFFSWLKAAKHQARTAKRESA